MASLAGALVALAGPTISVALDLQTVSAKVVTGGSLIGGLGLLCLAAWGAYLESQRDRVPSPVPTAAPTNPTFPSAQQHVGSASVAITNMTGGNVYLSPPTLLGSGSSAAPSQATQLAAAPLDAGAPGAAQPQPRRRGATVPVRRARLLRDPTTAALLTECMRVILSERRLTRPIELWGERNEYQDHVGNLGALQLLAQWEGGEFFQPSAEALAYVLPTSANQIVEWTEKTIACLVDADIAQPNRTWSVTELAARCGLESEQFAIALLYVRFLVTGCNPGEVDRTTGLPTIARLDRHVRTAPKEGLRAKIDRELKEAAEADA
ncbi:MAG: hypothetical protein HS111_21915 [Kofleriaceae bacterium]|nr:hypothetical protein [Kofleriaceae bacterium]